MGIVQDYRKKIEEQDTDRNKKIAAGRSNFRTYCNLRKPDFFKPERE